ncbi:hypothetical protein GGH94_000659 [Coemansia aciculifera]|uniref:RING-type domain-containing protein n=1 Tax=Coemansia aciculifera TaxID=417176 RepID=A0A9W8IMU1_9FUNG|nr:hypothetical protein GGH94_000659 [Coemansia aciculifera]
MRPFSRFLALLNVFLGIAQVFLGIVMLSISSQESCDRPLRAFVIVYMVWIVAYYPTRFASQLAPHRDQPYNSAITQFIKLCRSPLFICGWALFFYGNYLAFASSSCRSEAPLLYSTVVTYILIPHILVTAPAALFLLSLIIVLLLIIFVPSVRMFFFEKKGAGIAQISQIPLVRYIDPQLGLAPAATPVSAPPSLHGDSHALRTSSNLAVAQSTTSLHSNSARPRRHGLSYIHIVNPFARIAHRLTRSRRQRAAELEQYKKQLSGPVPGFTPGDAEDRMCAICLSSYEDGEILRLLPCKHHMHQSCVDEWLHINRTCPLCKREATTGAIEASEADIEHPTATSNCTPTPTSTSPPPEAVAAATTAA